MRRVTIDRKTNETTIQIQLNLDGVGKAEINTGIGFFDHMLNQLAVHGLFDLVIDAVGDLEVDCHHTVEDVGLALGEAFNRSLDDRKGIVRMASAIIPMDDALCEVAVDLSGRPYFVFSGDWRGELVSNLPVSLIEHFFYSFSMAMKANLHINIRYGQDNHHQTEAAFKAVASALRDAVQIDLRRQNRIPSSKGVL